MLEHAGDVTHMDLIALEGTFKQHHEAVVDGSAGNIVYRQIALQKYVNYP
jgi:hypothetical protein